MPLPDVALERSLGIDLELVDVDAFAEQLLQRLDQARVMRHQPERLVVGVGGEGGARRTGLLAPDLAIAAENVLRLVAQDRDLLLGEAIRKEQVTLLVEGPIWSGVSCMASSRGSRDRRA